MFQRRGINKGDPGDKNGGGGGRDRERGITGGERGVKKEGEDDQEGSRQASPQDLPSIHLRLVRGEDFMNGRKTRGRAVPKSDQVLVALRLLWISGWA